MSGSRYTVVATVGTDVHPFDRMVDWIDEWALANDAGGRVFIQYGTSRKPMISAGTEYLDYGDLKDMIAAADVVITHGGPATIMEVRAIHGTPIVVPRDPLRGEHVDGHQLDFCHMLARRGDIHQATSASDLAELIDHHLATPGTRVRVDTSVVPEGIRQFAIEVDRLLGRPSSLGDS